eukprot:NODE_1010_length_2706_cov_1.208669.p1 type:complete len:538 gc:universal NODE_1010_length_2706_cov_1.208669:1704-91(-)
MKYSAQFKSKKGRSVWKEGLITVKAHGKYKLEDQNGDWIAEGKITGDIENLANLCFYHVRSEERVLIDTFNHPGQPAVEPMPIDQDEASFNFDFVALYSPQLHKKVKNYSDGYISINGDYIVLYDEEKKKLTRDLIGSKVLEVGSEFTIKFKYHVYIDQVYKSEDDPKKFKEIEILPSPKKVEVRPFKPFKTPFKKNSKNAATERILLHDNKIVSLKAEKAENEVLSLLEKENEDVLSLLESNIEQKQMTKRHLPQSSKASKRPKFEIKSLDDLALDKKITRSRRHCIEDIFKNSEDYFASLKKAIVEHVLISSNLQFNQLSQSKKDKDSKFLYNNCYVYCKSENDGAEIVLRVPKSLSISINEIWAMSKSENFQSCAFVVATNRVFPGKNQKYTDIVINSLGTKNSDVLDNWLSQSSKYPVCALQLGFHFDVNVINTLDQLLDLQLPIFDYLSQKLYNSDLNLNWKYDWETELELIICETGKHLNFDQETLVHTIARSVFEHTDLPVTLCHGNSISYRVFWVWKIFHHRNIYNVTI